VNEDSSNNEGAGRVPGPGEAGAPTPSIPTPQAPPPTATRPAMAASVPQQQPPIHYAPAPTEAAYPAQGKTGYGKTGFGKNGPGKKRWWSIPKVVVAGVIAVLLAGAGGGAIGYGVGAGSAAYHGFASGQFKGGRYHNYQGGGSGQNSQVTPAPGTGSDYNP
jgi:hypothetical protein